MIKCKGNMYQKKMAPFDHLFWWNIFIWELKLL